MIAHLSRLLLGVLLIVVGVSTAYSEELLGSVSFDAAAATTENLRFGAINGDPSLARAGVQFDERPGAAAPMFRTLCRLFGDAAVRVPVSLGSVESVVLEDVLWFRLGKDNFGRLAGDAGGWRLLAFSAGGPGLRLRAHPTQPEAKLEYHDGGGWRDTGVELRPETDYRLRTVLNLDLRGQTADVFLSDGGAEKPLLRRGKFPPLAPDGLERIFAGAGAPKFALELAGWQLWDVTARRIEPLRTRNLDFAALLSRHEPRTDGDATLVRSSAGSAVGSGVWAALPVRRGLEEPFSEATPGRGVPVGWTGPARVVTGVPQAEGHCLELSEIGSRDKASRHAVSLPACDWIYAVRFRFPAELTSGRVVHIVEFQARQAGGYERVGPYMTLRVDPAPPGRPMVGRLTMIQKDGSESGVDNPGYTVAVAPDVWHVLTVTARPAASRYTWRLVTQEAAGQKTIADPGNKEFAFVGTLEPSPDSPPIDLTADPRAELVLGADPAGELPKTTLPLKNVTKREWTLVAAGLGSGARVRGLAVDATDANGVPDKLEQRDGQPVLTGRPMLLTGDGHGDRGTAVALTNTEGTLGNGPQKLWPLNSIGPTRAIAYDKWLGCWWLLTPERPDREPGDSRIRRSGLAAPVVMKMEANFRLAEWPIIVKDARGRVGRTRNPLSEQRAASDLAVGPEELFLLGNTDIRCYEKGSGAFKRTLAFGGIDINPRELTGIAYGGGWLFLALRPNSKWGNGILVADPVGDTLVGRLAHPLPGLVAPLRLAADDRRLWAAPADIADVRLFTMELPTREELLGLTRPYLLVDRVDLKPVAQEPELDASLIPAGPPNRPPVSLKSWSSGRDKLATELCYVGSDPGQYRRLRLRVRPPTGLGVIVVELDTRAKPLPDAALRSSDAKKFEYAPTAFFLGSLPASAGLSGPLRAPLEELLRRAGPVKWPEHLAKLPRKTEGYLLPAAAGAKPTAVELELDLVRDLRLSEGDLLRQISMLGRNQMGEWSAERIWLVADDRSHQTNFAGTVTGPVLELAVGEDAEQATRLRLAAADWKSSPAAGAASVKLEYRIAEGRYELADGSSGWQPLSAPGGLPATAPVGRYFQWRARLATSDPYLAVRLSDVLFTFARAEASTSSASNGSGKRSSPDADASADSPAAIETSGTSLPRWAMFGLLTVVGLGVAWFVLLRTPSKPSAV